MESENSNTKHGVPALFSFFILGLGQFVKGQFLKAIVLWLIYISVLVIGFWIYIGNDIPRNKLLECSFLGIGIIILWLWNIYDAYNS